jgi:hypothetical protein
VLLRGLAAAFAVALLGSVAALVLLTRSERGAAKSLRSYVPPTALSPEQVVRTPAWRGVGRSTAGPFGASLVRPVLLRDRPGGRILRALGTRTEFGSRRVLAVVDQRPGWLAVLTHHVGNSRAAWIPVTGAQLLFEPYTLHVDLSARTLVVRHEGRVARRISVAIGRPGSATPTGRFAVTDTLVTGRAGSPYGCCALALTGRQPNVPQGWTGGDRLAIHGTTNARTIGTAASGGCLRAGEADMRWLIDNVPLGSLVSIRA